MNNATDHAAGYRRFEIVAVLAIVAGYVVFQRTIADRWFFVLPALAVAGVYIGLSITRSGRTAAEFGIGHHNLRACTWWVSLVVAVMLTAGMIVSWRNGTRVAPSFAAVLFIYPLWGLAQQFLFQSLFQENLIRLGAGWWSVLLTTALFVAVHYPSGRLMGFAAVGGLIFSVLYRRYRNIVPLGVAHGLCGAILYHMIFGVDLMQRFAPP
jgi:membrane protease YdiL (CAAX protease family)